MGQGKCGSVNLIMATVDGKRLNLSRRKKQEIRAGEKEKWRRKKPKEGKRIGVEIQGSTQVTVGVIKTLVFTTSLPSSCCIGQASMT